MSDVERFMHWHSSVGSIEMLLIRKTMQDVIENRVIVYLASCKHIE